MEGRDGRARWKNIDTAGRENRPELSWDWEIGPMIPMTNFRARSWSGSQAARR
ncbi:MAG: hypothetical protein LBT86_02360 [Deltaproteobacteria bacterium]|nr:hypothetical protein [Deltaproteobacteria bacterium]